MVVRNDSMMQTSEATQLRCPIFVQVCKAGEKPLYLATLLQRFRGQKTIVFTASVEETHRLYLLLTTFEDLLFEVVEYSSWQHQLARR